MLNSNLANIQTIFKFTYLLIKNLKKFMFQVELTSIYTWYIHNLSNITAWTHQWATSLILQELPSFEQIQG